MLHSPLKRNENSRKGRQKLKPKLRPGKFHPTGISGAGGSGGGSGSDGGGSDDSEGGAGRRDR
jgi:hypothetical protein